eukprot:CAMPEP_0116139534 /NCGR_PEP_ID=MMETSP0329-20121206/13364_1 /TAXON_ID=697910 /ORGANISM="Pseudo-nitzschia arenysensis, Strain B593" /LENGTH=233 /DNA_ID=CAMNT_0003634585 /DNA_START=204 /DNA_END=905 /DNA_ORIENTATION=-
MEAAQQEQQQMPPPPPTPPQQDQVPPTQPASGRGSGRGGRGRGRGGGRTSSSGRGLVNVNARGGGRGRGGPQQGKVSANTGIPFGHVPSYLPGSSSLVEELDTRIMIVLRDGRHLVGNLRTFDQYSNLVLDGASERSFHSNDEKDGDKIVTYYTDVPLGMYIVRGDSIVLLGQVGSEEEEEDIAATQSIVVMKKVENEAFENLVAAAEETEDAGDEEGSKSQLEWDFDKDLLA